ncbi:DsbA family oxidoreductase [Nakamurella deserti]|uniref:DsbA family oxidoreductase n=1 Tax=Nakamurella deserti TaxID=2164074 RepID=UPI000DBE5098|nr:DsbA family oxidoreductase [Nakamurella deserti]
MTADTPTLPTVTVDVWSDIACPWCFIGKRKFEAALAAFRERSTAGVEVTYHSYELSPETPVDFDGSELQFLVQHKGIPATEVRAMLGRVTGIAAEVGLSYDFDALQHTNTVLAHQFLHHAREHGVQAQAYERLFQAYFEQGRHVGRVDELAALGAEVGLDPTDIRAALTDGRHLAAVRADQAAAADAGVRGVPHFVIGGRYVVRGAAEPAEFLAALEAATSP